MIQSVLIDHSKLEQIAEYRLLLTEITLRPITPQAKAALLRSLKHGLEVALQRESKKMKWLASESTGIKERSEGRESQQVPTRSKEIKQLSAFASMRVHHKAIIHNLCSQFELRDHFSISLSLLQQELTKFSSKYQRQARQHDASSQARTLSAIRQIHAKIAQILAALASIRESVFFEYEILIDNIKLLKVKNAILKNELSTNKQGQVKAKGKISGLVNMPRLDSIEVGNQNRNQILVNL